MDVKFNTCFTVSGHCVFFGGGYWLCCLKSRGGKVRQGSSEEGSEQCTEKSGQFLGTQGRRFMESELDVWTQEGGGQ